MNVQELQEQIEKLDTEDRIRLWTEIGLKLCPDLMQSPGGMERMMSRCEEMMRAPAHKTPCVPSCSG